MANDFPATTGQLYDRILMDPTFYIAITAHNPLARFDPLLAALEAYAELPGYKYVQLYIDSDHAEDVTDLKKLLTFDCDSIEVSCVVAAPEYEGYFLTWAHKPQLKKFVSQKAFTYYIYAENDMLFSVDNFNYWLQYRDFLRPLNLEPGFCRYELYNGQKIPFDNHRQWNLNGPTLNVWGSRSYNAMTYFCLDGSPIAAFVSLGNPYGGLMILDQRDAERYINSDSCDFNKSYSLTAHRNWPIADRSSMGLAFEDLKEGQEHRRVVPLILKNKKPVLAPCGLVCHQDTKYSEELSAVFGELITVDTMFNP